MKGGTQIFQNEEFKVTREICYNETKEVFKAYNFVVKSLLVPEGRYCSDLYLFHVCNGYEECSYSNFKDCNIEVVDEEIINFTWPNEVVELYDGSVYAKRSNPQIVVQYTYLVKSTKGVPMTTEVCEEEEVDFEYVAKNIFNDDGDISEAKFLKCLNNEDCFIKKEDLTRDWLDENADTCYLLKNVGRCTILGGEYCDCIGWKIGNYTITLEEKHDKNTI